MIDTSSSGRNGDTGSPLNFCQGLSTEVDPPQSGTQTSKSGTPSSPGRDTFAVPSSRPVDTILVAPVSKLLAPVALSSPARRKPATTPVSQPRGHRQYTCRPSPLSSCEPSGPPRGLPIFNVPSHRRISNHGYSRQGLMHAKWFWAIREEDWGSKPSADTKSAPLSTSILALPKGPTANRNRPRNMRPLEDPVEASLMNIYPRRGDIAALRDPYCAQADECLANVPIWTAAKVLWVHDMRLLSDKPIDTGAVLPTGDGEDDEFDESASEVSFDTTTSVGFSDDSESTLVDDGEWESSWSGPSRCESRCNDVMDGWSDKSPPLSRTSSTTSVVTKPSFQDNETSLSWVKEIYLRPSKPCRVLLSRERPLNWYRRLDLLLEVSHCKRRPEKIPPTILVPLSTRVVEPLPRLVLEKLPKPNSLCPPSKRLSFTKGLLTGFGKHKTGVKISKMVTSSSPLLSMQDSYLTPSHPATG